VASKPKQWRPCPEFLARQERRVRTANQPESAGLELAAREKGVTQPVPLVYLPVSLTAPGPSGSTEPTRLCRGCSPLSGDPRLRLPPASPRRCDDGEMDGLSPPSGTAAPRGTPISVPLTPRHTLAVGQPRPKKATPREMVYEMTISRSISI
jgi:hypothetical protein